jgi:hypothetical protein
MCPEKEVYIIAQHAVIPSDNNKTELVILSARSTLPWLAHSDMAIKLFA